MVQEGRRNATSNVRAIGEAAFWKISFVCRTRGDCALAGARLHRRGGSASDRTGGVNDLSGVAAQRRHSVSGGLEYRAIDSTLQIGSTPYASR